MRLLYSLLLMCMFYTSTAQNFNINGSLLDDAGEIISFADVILYDQNSNEMVKGAVSDESGIFKFVQIESGKYYILASYLGFDNIRTNVELINSDISLGNLSFHPVSIELEEAVVKTKRSILEVKADRIVFNVEGTINSTGGDGLSLLRKAPGVLLDNNDNITVLGRTGVLVYVDGKRLPLSGDDLTGYLQNMSTDQIDRIDIITNPGAKYEAEGNAGILDIRLKKNKNHGTNGNLSANLGRGEYTRGNASLNMNHRNNVLNTFGSIGGFDRTSFHNIIFLNKQNGLIIDEIDYRERRSSGINYRLGMDFYLSKNKTIGFLVSGNNGVGGLEGTNRGVISTVAQPNLIDSILVANNTTENSRNNQSYNVNYNVNNKNNTTNIDLDFGRYNKESNTDQPNIYYNATEDEIVDKVLIADDKPVAIDIYTAKLDHEHDLWGGRAQLGAKLSMVHTDNTFLFYNINELDERILNNQRSNQFTYDELVYAAYAGYNRSLGSKINISTGLRMEITDALGDLTPFDPSLIEDPVKLDYFDLFPTAGISYMFRPKHSFALNYGKRINRPDYNVLNPFREQLSELSYAKGNPFLRPEIVHNLELGYTIAYRYNIKLAYSKTFDQITRIIAPAEDDPRAGFISWENLTEQTIYSISAALPIEMASWWNAFFNLTGKYQNNQASYENGGIVDLQAYSYNIYQQHTFSLPAKYSFEVSGWYSGPGIWGGVFKYEPSWSLNMGIQKKFLNEKLNVKLSMQDIFYETGWSGYSSFNGLYAEGSGSWDSRRIELSASYAFGNRNIKSRKRKTGIEDESKRVSSGN